MQARNRRNLALALFALLLLLLLGVFVACSGGSETPPPSSTATPPPTSAPPASAPPPSSAAAEPDALPNGLLLAYSQFTVDGGTVTATPGPARAELLYRQGGEWHVDAIEDPDSNVFHKVLVYTPPGGTPGILTLGGTRAFVKLWHHSATGWTSETLWTEDFGGHFSRMRDAEVANLYGDGPAIAVATHDQHLIFRVGEFAFKGGFEIVGFYDLGIHVVGAVGRDLNGEPSLLDAVAGGDARHIDVTARTRQVWRHDNHDD